MIRPTAKMSEEVNKECRLNTTVQLSSDPRHRSRVPQCTASQTDGQRATQVTKVRSRGRSAGRQR